MGTCGCVNVNIRVEGLHGCNSKPFNSIRSDTNRKKTGTGKMCVGQRSRINFQSIVTSHQSLKLYSPIFFEISYNPFQVELGSIPGGMAGTSDEDEQPAPKRSRRDSLQIKALISNRL